MMSSGSVANESADDSLSADVICDNCGPQFIERAPLTRITNGLSTSACLKRCRSSVIREDIVPDVIQEAADVCNIFLKKLW